MSWLSRLSSGLKKTSSHLTEKISEVFARGAVDKDTLGALEEVLIQADLGAPLAAQITQKIAQAKLKRDLTLEDIKEIAAQEIQARLQNGPQGLELLKDRHQPHVVLMVGVNGSGKTTTCAKLASYYKAQGKSVAIAACDTFRAAATEQLQVWGERLGIPIIKGAAHADPAGLAYHAYETAVKEKWDVLLVDTAGRLHTNHSLMEELKKIIRVLNKIDKSLPHDCLMVVDGTAGQNAYAQVSIFQEAVKVTALVVTKLDGTARGGVVVGISERFHLPICAIGVGEQQDDLQPFESVAFSRSLLGLAC